MANKIKIKRGEKANLPVLERGEFGYATDTNELYIGVEATPDSVNDNVLVNDYDFGSWPPPSDDPFGTPGSQFFLEGASTESDGQVAGFFGQVTQEDFGITMEQVMSDLGITQGTAQFTDDGLLKFIHRGKIKFINRRPIRHTIWWGHIHSQLSASGGQGVYGGRTLTFGGHSYKVRLMRGWGQVSANSNNTYATPNYETGPLFTLSFATGNAVNSGVNWPTNTSGWSANNPNEWNTLIFPIASASQSQTDDVPNWASYSNADLQIASGNGRTTWIQETPNTNTGARVDRGFNSLAFVNFSFATSGLSVLGLRLVFEHIPAE